MNNIKLQFGDVREKNIFTKNDFISHMIEQIAWRLGISITVAWNDEDYFALGECLGNEIKKFQPKQQFGVALGMIDDGSAEIKIELGKVNKFLNIYLNSIDESIPLKIPIPFKISVQLDKNPIQLDKNPTQLDKNPTQTQTPFKISIKTEQGYHCAMRWTASRYGGGTVGIRRGTVPSQTGCQMVGCCR